MIEIRAVFPPRWILVTVEIVVGRAIVPRPCRGHWFCPISKWEPKAAVMVVEHWAGGVRATGGAIVAEKSYWYLIDFEWKGNRWHYRKKDSMECDLDIHSVDGKERVTL